MMSPQSHLEPLSGSEPTSLPRRKALNFNLEENAGAQSAMQVAKALIEAGFEAYLAGGAVRDLILNRDPKDFDIATNAKPKEVLKLFKITKKVGIAFGVVLVNDFSETIEVATFRTDVSYSDGRHPDKIEFSNAAEDAQRRDFTVNGLFYDLNSNEVVDYIGGLHDIEKQVIQAIGSAPQRFGEDYLRMLRAIRFSITLSFNIEESTWLALQEYAPNIESIAEDRIHEELRKTFEQNKSDKALQLLDSSQLLKHCLPNAQSHWKCLNKTPDQGGELPVILALLMQDQEDRFTIEAKLNDLRCTNPEKKKIQAFLRSLQNFKTYPSLVLADRKRCLRQFEKDDLTFFLEHSQTHQEHVEAIQNELNSWSQDDLHPPLMLRGKDLLDAGWPKGPHIGKALLDLETELLNNSITQKSEIQNWLETYPQK